MSESKYTEHPDLQKTMKAVLRGKLIAASAYIKVWRDLTLAATHLKALEQK